MPLDVRPFVDGTEERVTEPKLGKKAYINWLGFFFFLRMAVAVSSSYIMVLVLPSAWVVCAWGKGGRTSLCSAPEASLERRVSRTDLYRKHSESRGKEKHNIRQVDLGLVLGVIGVWLGCHVA